ncbi:ABC transporter ATP-binding protein [Methanobacterium petrolearium]|uniref:ABC transporter ATP-binding protein n=1 Tax=Methanobacterium petrolearium TaxID=710190 RepID=UPI001AE3292A|nr:ABC transporter ATP-binding protein [Methanobacterium petrolearium]MBP1945358.1 methyl coenzyme M reductase system subunit A2 [Methanobacterium petrolearium]BDZ71547.1 ABC transporter ATP-binding protein [Methanobacterium petrolearium]
MIKVENLSKTYHIEDGPDIKALDNVNLEVEKGEILGIIGTSGSGKSTLLRVLRGVESFEEGEITIDDVTVTPDSTPYYSRKLRKLTAIHLQRSFGLWSETALNNVIRKLYGTKYGDESLTDFDFAYGEFEAEAMEILRVVGLDHKANHFAPVLSGGEKQRLIMARQLAKKPEVLLLDEPATMSCPKTKQEILDAIKTINNDLGVTVILVSHLPEVHHYLSQRLVLMEEGRVVGEGSPDEIIKRFLKKMEPKVDGRNPEDIGDEIIKARDLKRKFYLLKGGNVLELEDINFDVNESEIVSLIGPSGAGKTVLLRIIGGLDQPDEGEVLFKLSDEWVDMHQPGISRMKTRRQMGFMHQEFALVHHAKLKDQIAGRLGVKGIKVVDEAKKKAEELGISDLALDVLYQLTDLPENEAKIRLEKIGLSADILDTLFPSFPDNKVREYAEPIFKALNLPLDVLNRRSYELSGGQKVRATLALVLTSKPKVLILDEPFGDLDPITLRMVSNSLKQINQKFDTTIIMVSHHIDFIEEVATRAIHMEDGKMIGDGKPEKECDEFIKRCKAEYLKDAAEWKEKIAEN